MIMSFSCVQSFIIFFQFQTIFNPNKTVVKVFVVLYDFNDMPCNTHTFLRQKIVSVKTDIDDQVTFSN